MSFQVAHSIFWKKKTDDTHNCLWLGQLTTAKTSDNVKKVWQLVHTHWRMTRLSELGMDKGNISRNCNYQDNEPAKTAVLSRHFLMKKWILLMECPPCYPDWDPWDFLLFPSTKHLLKETHFGSLEQVQQHTSHTIQVMLEDFQIWHKTTALCMASHRN